MDATLSSVARSPHVADDTKARIEALRNQAQLGVCKALPPPASDPGRVTWEEWSRMPLMTKAKARELFELEAGEALRTDASATKASGAELQLGGDRSAARAAGTAPPATQGQASPRQAGDSSDQPARGTLVGLLQPSDPASTRAPAHRPILRMETAADAAPGAKQPSSAESPWPSTVRGTLLKRCGLHGWRPRYATLKPAAKVFRYSRAKDDAVPRLQMALDSTVTLSSRPSFKSKWPGLSTAVDAFPFVVHSPLGDMHFASRSEESRSKWIDALTWSVELAEPIAARPGSSRRAFGMPSPAGSVSIGNRSSARLGSGAAANGGAASGIRSAAEPRALFARPSQSDEGEDAAAGAGGSDVVADGADADADSAADSDGLSDDETGEGDHDDAAYQEALAASKGFGPVPTSGVPAWAVRAGEQHQRETIMRCSEEGKARCWSPNGSKDGLQCFTAKGGPPGARGDGVVPWPLVAILDILQDHREDVDEQLVSQTHIASMSKHFIVSQMRYKSPSVFVGPREFVTLTHWRMWGGSDAADVGIPDGTLVISASSLSIPESVTSVPVTSGHTRGDVPIGGWVIRPRPPASAGAVSTVCDAVYMSTLDPKGNIPHSVVQIAVGKQSMMVKALNEALAARYGGPTWDKAPKARASGPAQQLRNEGWKPPPSQPAPGARRAAGGRIKSAAVAPLSAARSQQARGGAGPPSAAGVAAGSASNSASGAKEAARSQPSSQALAADTQAATGAGRSDWLRLPADDDPSLSRPHRINPLALLVLLLPLLAWVLAAAVVPPHDGAPVPALPMPPAPLLDGARAVAAAVDGALATAVDWAGMASSADEDADDAKTGAATVTPDSSATKPGSGSGGATASAEVLPSGSSKTSNAVASSGSGKKSRRSRRRRTSAQATDDDVAAPAEPPVALPAPPRAEEPHQDQTSASAPTPPALAFSPTAGPLSAVPGLAILAVTVHPHLAAHVFVLACVAFACRWLYRAVVGPAWMSTRQKLSIASWNPPGEGNIHGAVQLDATRALAWLAEARAATGKRLTVTHLVIKAVGLALRACPQLNGRVVLGEFIPAGSVDVGCLVAMEREEGGVKAGDLAYTKILAADRRPVGAIAGDIAGAASRLRALKDAEFESSKGAMRALPTWALRPVSHYLGWVSSALGLPIPLIGVRAFPVGSCMVTAVGGLGLDTAFAPFTPFLHVPLLVAIGSVKDTVLPVDGAPAVRKAVTITATVDHRVVDGAGAAVLSRVLRAVFEQPAAMLGPPATAAVN